MVQLTQNPSAEAPIRAAAAKTFNHDGIVRVILPGDCLFEGLSFTGSQATVKSILSAYL
jgi:hypothetical protein